MFSSHDSNILQRFFNFVRIKVTDVTNPNAVDKLVSGRPLLPHPYSFSVNGPPCSSKIPDVGGKRRWMGVTEHSTSAFRLKLMSPKSRKRNCTGHAICLIKKILLVKRHLGLKNRGVRQLWYPLRLALFPCKYILLVCYKNYVQDKIMFSCNW